MSLIRLINAHDDAYRALGNHDLPAGNAWDADVRQVEAAAVSLLAYDCNSMKRYRRWIGYIRSVSDLSRRVSPEKARAKAEVARLRDPATKNRRDQTVTYEFGIDGTDRINPVPPEPLGPYHKRYPLDVMEVGETMTIPGMRNRSELGVTLQSAESRHKRKFKTKATEAGLRIERVI